MSLSRILPGKANPVFVGHGEAPANSVSGERLQPSRPVPRPVVSRTRAEAQAKGLGGPEALDLTRAEVSAWAGVPPESAPRSTLSAEWGLAG
jgi:hypothetical protein